MMPDELQFDEATHTYTMRGVQYPSVTTILKDAGLIDASQPWYTEWHRERGKHVHAALEYHDSGELDEDALDPEIRPYLDAWERFLRESRAEVVDCERRYVDICLGYAGTLDRVVWWNRELVVIDIKTGPHERWHAIQTAAYANIRTPKVSGRATVSLAGGKLSVKTHTNRSDWDVFRSALALFHWKRSAA